MTTDGKPGVNIWSGAFGLPGALTNMSAKAWENGRIKNNYPVVINGKTYEDAEAAYQGLKARRPSAWQECYNDGLMVDIIALKFLQHRILREHVLANGGADWLALCAHNTGARSARFQAWEGVGRESRFIRNLIAGYEKALTGRGAQTRVVHVHEAPFDVYIGRQMGNGETYAESVWQNPFKLNGEHARDAVIAQFHAHLQAHPTMSHQVAQLHGKTLGCWCKHKEAHDVGCHGDVLSALADGRPWEPPVAVQKTLF